jgi:hypothetical protein
LPAAAPPSARLPLVTVLPVPTAAVSKLPVPLQVTTSLPTTPVSVQAIVRARRPVVGLVRAVIAGVSVAAVMFAVVVAVVADSA